MNDPSPSIPPPRKKRPWWLWLLVSVGGLVLLAIVLIVGVFAYAKSLVNTYTTTAPRALPKVQFDPNRLKELEQRWVAFAAAVQQRQNPPPFRLTADDLNQFVARFSQAQPPEPNRGKNSPSTSASGADVSEGREQVFFVITNGQVQAHFTFPLDRTGQPGLKGRHLNGTADINVDFRDGWLTVTLGSVRANDKPIPGWILKKLQQQSGNLLKELDRNRDFVNLMQEIEGFEIQDGAIAIKPYASPK